MPLQGDSVTFFLIQCKEHSHYRVHHLLPHIQQHLWLHALVTRQQLEGQEGGEGEGTVAQQRHISPYSNAAHTLTTYAPDVTVVQRTREPHRPQKAASTNQHTHSSNISPPLTIMLTSPYVVVTHDHVYSTEHAHHTACVHHSTQYAPRPLCHRLSSAAPSPDRGRWLGGG